MIFYEKDIPKIVHEAPEIWPEVEKRLGLKWEGHIVCTYAGVIHTPDDELAPDVIYHELVHVEQQKRYPDGPRAFFDRFMEDRDFRLSVELEAYRAQWQFIRRWIPLAIDRLRALEKLSADLAGPMYDLDITISKARHLISRTRAGV